MPCFWLLAGVPGDPDVKIGQQLLVVLLEYYSTIKKIWARSICLAIPKIYCCQQCKLQSRTWKSAIYISGSDKTSVLSQMIPFVTKEKVFHMIYEH